MRREAVRKLDLPTVSFALALVLLFGLGGVDTEQAFAKKFRKPTLSAKFVVAETTVRVNGTIGKGGPRKPPRKSWRVVLEERPGKKWETLAKARLTKKRKGSKFALKWTAPAYRTDATVRVRVKAGSKTVVAGRAKRLNLRAGSIPKPEPGPEDPTLRINLNGASGLALKDPSAANLANREHYDAQGRSPLAEEIPGSNLDVVEEDGEVRDAVSSGDVSIRHMQAGPDGSLYFEVAGSSDPGLIGCTLVKLPPGAEIPICIDSSISSIVWRPNEVRNPIQFDADGDAYYLGVKKQEDDPHGIQREVIRKAGEDGSVEIFSDAAHLSFAALPDGSVVIAGNPITYLKRILPNGSEQTLHPNFSPGFMDIFPDGNLYVGGGFRYTDSLGVVGVQRFLGPEYEPEAKYWIAYDEPGLPDLEFYYDSSERCPTYVNDGYGFCQGRGTTVGRGFRGDGELFYVTGFTFNPITRGTYQYLGELVRYFPDVGFPDTAVAKIGANVQLGDRMLLTGKDENGARLATLFNPISEQETVIPGFGSDMEIGLLSYSESQNAALYVGRYAGTSTYLIGTVDLATLEVTKTEITEREAYFEVVAL